MDDINYTFLIDTCGLRKYEYSFLNSLAYVSLILVTLAYN
jgi:hypothetical protein